MTRKVMKLLNPSTGLMECRVCERRHVANLRSGKYLRGSWQCLNGCKLLAPGRAPRFDVIQSEPEPRTISVTIERT